MCVGVCLQVEEAGAGDACFECYIICVCVGVCLQDRWKKLGQVMHVLNVTLYVCVGVSSVCLQVEEAGAGERGRECETKTRVSLRQRFLFFIFNVFVLLIYF